LFNPSSSSSRSAKPWQAASTLLSHVDETGFAVGAWAKADAKGFADAGLKLDAKDYAPRQYEAVKQPLLQKTLDALSRLDDDLVDQFDQPKNKKKTRGYVDESPNAHLPFVMDVYAPVGSKKKKAATPALPQRTANWADHIETIVHEDLLGESSAHELIAAHDQQVAEQIEVHDHEGLHAESVASEADTSVMGLDEEELARREAVQFETGHAQGVIQGREEGLTQGRAEGHEKGLVEGLAQGKEQGLAQGREEGLSEGRSQGLSEGRLDGFDKGVALGRTEGLQEGYQAGLAEGRTLGHAAGFDEGHAQGREEGLAQGERQASETFAEEMAAQREVFTNAAEGLQALLKDSKQFFEPLKRLALHMAEQLVLGELSASPQAIERLVQRCLDELDHPVKGVVVLELHPDDKARLQKQGSELTRGMRLEAVHYLQPGSVRVFANDTVVEDLVENRLQALANSLSIDTEAWRKQSALLAPAESAQEDQEPKASKVEASAAEDEAEADSEVDAAAEVPDEAPAAAEEDLTETEKQVESDDAHS
jgi:flagellar biosynthesis/type III secretory pathway protein FliH